MLILVLVPWLLVSFNMVLSAQKFTSCRLSTSITRPFWSERLHEWNEKIKTFKLFVSVKCTRQVVTRKPVLFTARLRLTRRFFCVAYNTFAIYLHALWWHRSLGHFGPTRCSLWQTSGVPPANLVFFVRPVQRPTWTDPSHCVSEAYGPWTFFQVKHEPLCDYVQWNGEHSWRRESWVRRTRLICVPFAFAIPLFCRHSVDSIDIDIITVYVYGWLSPFICHRLAARCACLFEKWAWPPFKFHLRT